MLFAIDYNRKPSKEVINKLDNFPSIVVCKDKWNDYSFMTSCDLYIFYSPNDNGRFIGSTRIMHTAQEKGSWVFENFKDHFDELSEYRYCSISNKYDFYKNLFEQHEDHAAAILHSINDLTCKPNLWRYFSSEECFEVSLLREKGVIKKLFDQVRREFFGEDSDTKDFKYTVQLPNSDHRIEIPFSFSEDSHFPSRVNLLVGPNGLGKTQILSKMAVKLSGLTQYDLSVKENEILDINESVTFENVIYERQNAGEFDKHPSFYNVIAMSFNAFDDFNVPNSEDVTPQDMRYTYCGIRSGDGNICDSEQLADRIAHYVGQMGEEEKREVDEVLGRVIGESEMTVEDLTDASSYYRLSAGQKIVVNVLVHMIVFLEKNTLVLFDKPELHLHPSLMTTLVNEFLRLLRENGSYAIVATHSPIVAQQIPSEYIHVLSKNEDYMTVSKPDIECFGGDLADIIHKLYNTREFFMDYRSILENILADYDYDIDEIEKDYGDRLGNNALAYIVAKGI